MRACMSMCICVYKREIKLSVGVSWFAISLSLLLFFVSSQQQITRILFVSLKMDKTKIWWWYVLVNKSMWFVLFSIYFSLACMLYFNHLLRYTFCWRKCIIIKNGQLQAGNEVKLFFSERQWREREVSC